MDLAVWWEKFDRRDVVSWYPFVPILVDLIVFHLYHFHWWQILIQVPGISDPSTCPSIDLRTKIINMDLAIWTVNYFCRAWRFVISDIAVSIKDCFAEACPNFQKRVNWLPCGRWSVGQLTYHPILSYGFIFCTRSLLVSYHSLSSPLR